MKLHEDNNWKAVHFSDRTVLITDRNYYSRIDWEELIYDIEVEPIEDRPGHYRVKED